MMVSIVIHNFLMSPFPYVNLLIQSEEGRGLHNLYNHYFCPRDQVICFSFLCPAPNCTWSHITSIGNLNKFGSWLGAYIAHAHFPPEKRLAVPSSNTWATQFQTHIFRVSLSLWEALPVAICVSARVLARNRWHNQVWGALNKEMIYKCVSKV